LSQRDLEIRYSIWTVLNKMLGDLTSKGVPPSLQVNADLRHSRLLISHWQLHLARGKATEEAFIADIDMLLDSARKILFEHASTVLGEDYVNKWKELLRKAKSGEFRVPLPQLGGTFIPGIPRDKDVDFVRIVLPRAASFDELKGIEKKTGAMIEAESENTIRISGKKEFVKRALDVISKRFFAQNKKQKE